MIGVQTIKLPYPHQGQQAVRSQARRFNWLSAGRRWRKTTLFMPIAVEHALNGGQYIWGAPTFDQVRVGFNEARRATATVATPNQARMSLTFPSGGVIYYRSLDNPDNARGFTADGVFIDEAGDVKRAAWYEVLRPMLIDTNGFAWIGGTPKGRNWFWREHVNAKDRPDSMSWQIPTLGVEITSNGLKRSPHPMENPDIPFQELEHMYDTLPLGTFRQEILAEFLENEGAVFRNIDANHQAPDSKPEDHKDHYIVAGVDWGKHNDYTVFSIGCATCKHELELYRSNQIDYAVQRGMMRVFHDKWGVDIWLAESNSMGEPIIEQLQRDGLPVESFQTTASSKPPLIENLKLSLEREEFQFLEDPIAKAELEAYEQKVSKQTGRTSYSAPSGMHDDTVMARALMRKMAQSSGEVVLW